MSRPGSRSADERLRVLVEASAILGSSLEYERTLQNVARMLVPRLADWCVIRVRSDRRPRGDLATRIVAADPSKRSLLQELVRRYPPDPRRNPNSPAAVVLRTGRPYVQLDVPEDWAARIARDARHRQIIEELAARSLIVVPMVVGRRTVGAITLALAESGRRFEDADVALAADLARRAAQAIDHARLFVETRRALRARNDLLASVSHDLRNPLAAIKGQSQLLERQAARTPPPSLDVIRQRARNITAIAESMGRLIEELVDVARLRLGQRLELDVADVEVVTLVRDAVAQAQATTQAHELVVETPDEPIVLPGDAPRLSRVFANLLSNAIKYSPAGGKVVTRVRREPRWAVVEVQDWGLGIPRRDVPHIFERFRRARRTEGGPIPGSGIGLAVVRQIVDLHRGRVEVQSEPGEGSTFTVRLPLAPARRLG